MLVRQLYFAFFAVQAFLLGFAPTAGAITIKNLEFNVDGVLPSSEPDIEFANSSAQTEASVYSVSGGLLEQTTFGIGVGNVSYAFPTPGRVPS